MDCNEWSDKNQLLIKLYVKKASFDLISYLFIVVLGTDVNNSESSLIQLWKLRNYLRSMIQPEISLSQMESSRIEVIRSWSRSYPESESELSGVLVRLIRSRSRILPESSSESSGVGYDMLAQNWPTPDDSHFSLIPTLDESDSGRL